MSANPCLQQAACQLTFAGMKLMAGLHVCHCLCSRILQVQMQA